MLYVNGLHPIIQLKPALSDSVNVTSKIVLHNAPYCEIVSNKLLPLYTSKREIKEYAELSTYAPSMPYEATVDAH